MLKGFFDQTDLTGYRVRFVVPPLRQATGEPALTLDFGDGTATWQTDKTGEVLHTYAAAGIFSAVLTDLDGVAQTLRFEVPHCDGQPWNVAHCPG